MLIAVGGADPGNMSHWRVAAVDGLALFQSGMSTEEIGRNAKTFINAFHATKDREQP